MCYMRRYLLSISLIVIVLIFNQSECHPSKVNPRLNQLTSYAISSIMNKIATSGVHSKTFTIYIVKNKNCFECFTDLMTKIMKNLNIAISIAVTDNSRKNLILSGVNVVLLNDYHNLTFLKFSANPTHSKSFLLAYDGYKSQKAENFTIVNNNFDTFEKTHLYHSQDMQSIFQFSNVLFDDERCNAVFKRTNAFNMSRLAWQSNMFYQTFEKVVKTSQKCSIRVYQLNGTFGQPDHRVFNRLIDLLAETYSFMPNYTYKESESHEILIFLNMIVIEWNQKSLMIHDYHRSNYISFHSITFVVTTGAPYTPFEKLILPFDKLTWILCFYCFVIGQLTIFIVLYCNDSVKHFIFGEKVTNPSLTMAQIFFGVGLVQVPGRNFS